jgi:hypothetical protein
VLRFRYPLAALSVLFLGVFLVSLLPVPRQQVENDEVSLPGLGYVASLGINYPTQLRLGTSDSFQLTTRLDAATGAPQTLSPETLMVVHFESACLTFDPPGDTAQALMLNDDQRWFWELTSASGENGPCDLILVVRLRQPYVAEEEVIYIRKLEIENTTLFGLSPSVLRAVGLVSGVVCLLGLAVVQWRATLTPRHPRP